MSDQVFLALLPLCKLYFDAQLAYNSLTWFFLSNSNSYLANFFTLSVMLSFLLYCKWCDAPICLCVNGGGAKSRMV